VNYYELRPPKEGVERIRLISQPNGKVKSGMETLGGWFALERSLG